MRADTYPLPIAAGQRVAVCEQVEDPKKAVGLVRREVTRVVTPGTVTDEALLEERTRIEKTIKRLQGQLKEIDKRLAGTQGGKD